MLALVALSLVLYGTVLAHDADGTFVVNHRSLAGMPGMTMHFEVRGGRPPHVGERISAHVDTHSEPWTLYDVRNLGSVPQERAFVPLLRVGDAVPGVPLVDQFGRRFSLRRVGAPTIVSFIYTRCPDPRMCPLVTAKFARLQRLLNGTGIRLLELTLDPVHDTPRVLRRYAEGVGARAGNWSFGTGPAPDVLALAERFGILRERVISGGIGHTEAVAIVSGNGTLQTLVAGNVWSPEDVAAEAREAAGIPSNPFRRLAFQLYTGVSAACGIRGAGGVPLIGAFAIFAACTIVLGCVAIRLFSAAYIERS